MRPEPPTGAGFTANVLIGSANKAVLIGVPRGLYGSTFRGSHPSTVVKNAPFPIRSLGIPSDRSHRPYTFRAVFTV